MIDRTQATGGAGPRRWHAGSLVYTSAGLASLFVWLLAGDFSYFLKERSVTPAMQLLLHGLHASNLVVGILLTTLPAVIGFAVVPMVAYHSDRHRGRWGRRIPFLAVPIPLTLVAMLGLAFSPAIGREIHRVLGRWSPGENGSQIAALALSWALFEACTGVCNSVYLSLIADVVPRAVMGRFFALFRIVSLLAGMIFLYWLFGTVERHCIPVFLGIGAIYGIGFTAMCLKVKEGRYPPAPPPAAEPGAARPSLLLRFHGGARAYWRDCFGLAYYRWVYLSFALAMTGGAAFNSFYVLYAKSVGMPMGTLGRYAALQLLFSLVQAYPIGLLADRFHPLRMTMVALGLLAAAVFAAFFLVHNATGYGIAVVGCGSLAGFWLTASASLPAVLFPPDKFAVLNSARLTTSSLGVLLAGPACGWLLDLRAHDYRTLFLWWGAFVLLALLATVAVYRRFVRCGGPENYVAPK